jgi:hypothetical protein
LAAPIAPPARRPSLHSAVGEILPYRDTELISRAKLFSRTSRAAAERAKLLTKEEARRIAANIASCRASRQREATVWRPFKFGDTRKETFRSKGDNTKPLWLNFDHNRKPTNRRRNYTRDEARRIGVSIAKLPELLTSLSRGGALQGQSGG